MDLKLPVQVNAKDLVFVGHGTYMGGASNITLPANLDLAVMEPVGVCLTVGGANALMNGNSISKVNVQKTGHAPVSWVPELYVGGALAPNMILHDLGPQQTALNAAIQTARSRGVTVVTVNADTNLQDLIKMPEVAKLVTAGKVRAYWLACAAQPTNPSAADSWVTLA